MGMNRFSDMEERERNETDAKAGDEVPKGARETSPLALRRVRGTDRGSREARGRREAQKAGTRFLALPSNTSHLTQRSSTILTRPHRAQK